jgi:lipoate-protein ligase A
MHWQVVDTGAASGAFNMRLDEDLARALQAGEGAPTLRLYRWIPWAISLGYNQNPAEIDREACLRDRIDIVRRPTGGRAILHSEELTYSVVMLAGRRSILNVYNEISRALVRGLELFGVRVSLQKSQPDFREVYRHASSIPCFTSSARYEIEWEGRKLVGSAQRRFGEGGLDVVLQHGSILCGPAHQRLTEYLAIADGGLRERLRGEMASKTVELSAICGRPVEPVELAPPLLEGFREVLGIPSGTPTLRAVPGMAGAAH